MNNEEAQLAIDQGPLSKHEYQVLKKLTTLLPDRQKVGRPRDLGSLTPAQDAHRRKLEVRLDIWGPP